MNVLKPFDVGITSNEDAIKNLEDYNPLEDIVTGEGFEVVRYDYDAVNALIPGYGFENMVEHKIIDFNEKRVSYLGLSSMVLECLSGEIGNLVELRRLYLGGNSLSVLPVEVGNLVKLECLDLHDNELSVLPVEVGNLVKLECLYLSNNGLSVLPEIGNLVELEYLGLSNNELSVLPVGVGNLIGLKKLDLDHNNLSVLPNELCDWLNLCYLNVIHNPLSDYSVVDKLKEKGVEVYT